MAGSFCCPAKRSGRRHCQAARARAAFSSWSPPFPAADRIRGARGVGVLVPLEMIRQQPAVQVRHACSRRPAVRGRCQNDAMRSFGAHGKEIDYVRTRYRPRGLSAAATFQQITPTGDARIKFSAEYELEMFSNVVQKPTVPTRTNQINKRSEKQLGHLLPIFAEELLGAKVG